MSPLHLCDGFDSLVGFFALFHSLTICSNVSNPSKIRWDDNLDIFQPQLTVLLCNHHRWNTVFVPQSLCPRRQPRLHRRFFYHLPSPQLCPKEWAWDQSCSWSGINTAWRTIRPTKRSSTAPSKPLDNCLNGHASKTEFDKTALYETVRRPKRGNKNIMLQLIGRLGWGSATKRIG